MKTEKHVTGRVAELEAEQYFTSRGYPVSYPTTEERYDFIIDDDGDLYRVQCKSTYSTERYGKERIAVEFRAGTDNSGYSEGELDAFVIYNPSHDELYWLWFDEAPATQTQRIHENWQPHRIEDYF